MDFKVVPFMASISNTQDASAAASQLDALIASQAEAGWEYVRLEKVDTYIAGTSGCFGLGATQGRTTSIAMAVFKK